MCGKINPLKLEGFVFGENDQFTILKQIDRGWEGEVYVVQCEKSELKAVKIIPFTESCHSFCPAWFSHQINFRKKNPLSDSIKQPTNWLNYAESEYKASVIESLKYNQKQLDIHNKVKSCDAHMLVPIIEEYGLLLLPGNHDIGFRPAIFQIMPPIQGMKLSELLFSIERFSCNERFLYKAPIQSSHRLPIPVISAVIKASPLCGLAFFMRRWPPTYGG